MAAQTFDLTAAVRNFIVDQGTTITASFSLADGETPLNMTGYDLRLQVRRSIADSTVLVNCTLANGKLAWVDQAQGQFKLNLAPLDTTSIRFTNDSPDVIEGVYDLEVVDSTGAVIKPCKGSFTIYREATR